MNDEMKFYLLAEESGFDCSEQAFQYGKTLKKSNAYQIYAYNVTEAKKHLSYKAIYLVQDFQNFNPEPVTMKEVFILESQLDYLALHSFPQYYLNPLTVDPNYHGEVTTIGELMFDYDGKEVELNDIILDETKPIEEKKRAVLNQVDFYLSDMNKIVSESQKRIRRRAFGNADPKKGRARSFLEILLFLSLNTFLFVLSLLQGDFIRRFFFEPNWHIFTTYLLFLYPIFCLITDIVFSLYHSYRAKISEAYNYARRSLDKNSIKVYQDIKNEKERLYDYICGAINKRIVLKDDIHDFSKLSSSYVDLHAVFVSSQLQKRKAYQVLRALNASFLTITSLVGVVFLIVLIMSAAFNITI